MVGDRVGAREFLGMTIAFDNDVIDGAPVAVFLQQLRKLMESGYGLHSLLPRQPEHYVKRKAAVVHGNVA